jgi:hypothetical protein
MIPRSRTRVDESPANRTEIRIGNPPPSNLALFIVGYDAAHAALQHAGNTTPSLI